MDPRWAQVIDVEVIRTVTEWLLPGLACPCCGTVTFAEPPTGAHAGAVPRLLMTDGYTGYQHLLARISGIEQCCQHVIRRCRAVMQLGPGGIIAVLREAHQAVEEARARGSTALDPQLLDKLRQR